MDYTSVYQPFNKPYAYSPIQPQPQIPFKPISYERVSDIIGITYNLSSMDNVSVLPAPRQNEQQIFFVNNDDKIYTRTTENGIGIVGYKQEYVQKIENELSEAQSQLYEIFNSITGEDNAANITNGTPIVSPLEQRLNKLEDLISSLSEGKENEPKRASKAMGSLSDLA